MSTASVPSANARLKGDAHQAFCAALDALVRDGWSQYVAQQLSAGAPVVYAEIRSAQLTAA